MSIGSPESAKVVYDWYKSANLSGRAPKGFKNLGSGSFRTALLEKSTGVVYKVGDHNENVSETMNSRRLRRKSVRSLGEVKVRVPYSRVYRFNRNDEDWGHISVVAQEYVQGRQTMCNNEPIWGDEQDCTCKSRMCFGTVRNILHEWSGLGDMHSENVLIDKDKIFWIIDLSN